MSPESPKQIQAYTAQRITFTSERSAADIIAALDTQLLVDEFEGFDATIREAIHANDFAAFEKAVQNKLGPTGFMLFDVLSYDPWRNFYTEDGKPLPLLKRYTVGDPRLAAARFLVNTPRAGLHAPVVLLVIGAEDGSGIVTYDLPSAGITLGAESGALKDVAGKLDGLVEGLVRNVTGN